ncbi:MAG: transketolase [Bacteroidota bacterium]
MSFNSDTDIKQLCINTIRFLAVDAVQKANSGHPGMPMGCAPIAFLLYSKLMKHNPANPKWTNRDRFVLSAGHGSALLYSVLHLSGYKIFLDDIKNFRQWGSITPGHPEYGLTPGVETTTGPLGQGFANAVGMALAQKFLMAKFNKENFKIVDHFIYVVASDGDLMEGISHEAASFAGHNKLGSLIVLYDNNGITIDGRTSLTFSEDVPKRFEAYGWHVQQVKDVNDLDDLEKALNNAQKEKDKPSLIVTNTHIGFGSPNKQDKPSAHGSPLGDEEVKLTKKNLGWMEEKTFFIPQEVYDYFSVLKERGEKLEEDWEKLFSDYSKQFPEEAALFQKVINGNFGNGWKLKLPKFENYSEALATRAASGKILNAIALELPTLIGGSADLTESNSTHIKEWKDFSPETSGGNYIHFGIREHAMAAIMNGMCYYGGVIPFGATFLVFSDYLRPAIRLAALSHLRPIYIFTHDSIGLGEDGPTHQPVEHLAALRSIPGLIVIRPADSNETVYAWKFALEHKNSPVALVLTRQKVLTIDRTKYSSAENTTRGAYILKDTLETPNLILMASGSEVSLALKAAGELEKDGIGSRVVSFPSWELFELQSEDYKEKILPQNIKARLLIEAGVKQGWEKYIGSYGDSISIEKYGASAPEIILWEKYGFTVENIVRRAKAVLEKL